MGRAKKKNIKKISTEFIILSLSIFFWRIYFAPYIITAVNKLLITGYSISVFIEFIFSTIVFTILFFKISDKIEI
jgi:hypothetical protein